MPQGVGYPNQFPFIGPQNTQQVNQGLAAPVVPQAPAVDIDRGVPPVNLPPPAPVNPQRIGQILQLLQMAQQAPPPQMAQPQLSQPNVPRQTQSLGDLLFRQQNKTRGV